METVETATDKTWDDDLMKGPNGEVVMSDVMKNQETTSSDMPVSIACYFMNSYLKVLVVANKPTHVCTLGLLPLDMILYDQMIENYRIGYAM